MRPLRESLRCHWERRAAARWGRSAGWLTEKMMSCAGSVADDGVRVEVDIARRGAGKGYRQDVPGWGGTGARGRVSKDVLVRQ